MSKQTRQPFPVKTEYQAGQLLGLLHADLCGPITPPTPAGSRYFMLIVDDAS